MKKTLLTVVGAAVAFTCLAWAQPPQGAKETVVIKEEAAPKSQPKETLPSPSSAPKPKVNRDPFVHGAAAAPPPPPPTPDKPPAAGPGKAEPGKGEAEITNTKVVVVPAPEVKVQGILLSGKGNRAIVVGPNTTFIVKQGDKLGDYKVSSITNKQVVFAFKDKKFPIKLESEFPDMEKK